MEAALAAADSEEDDSPHAEFTLEQVSGSGEPPELSLVTTQALRKKFAGDGDVTSDPDVPEEQGGYNPYDKG